MGSDAGGRYSYTDGNADLYGLLGIEGTTYQMGFDGAAKLLGDVSGKTFLDFGCGTGPIPLPDASVDGAISMSVFIEWRRSATRSGTSAIRTPVPCGAATRLRVS